MKKAEIKLTIDLDDNNVPESITWESTDAENKEALPVKIHDACTLGSQL